MPNLKVTQLTANPAAASVDLLYLVDSVAAASRKITVANHFRSLPVGSAAAPGLAFAADPDTGLYRSAANRIGLAGDVTLTQIDPPGAPTVAVNPAAGNLNGNYYYCISYVTASGETSVWQASTIVAPANQQVDLTNIPVSADPAVVGRNVYRTVGGGHIREMYLVANIPAAGTTYTDNLADGGLGVVAPRINTTGGMIFHNAERALVMGYDATALGVNVLSVNQGYANTAIGFHSLQVNSTGKYNTGLGVNSLLKNTTGSYNTALGVDCLVTNVAGHYNTAVGCQVLCANTGDSNTGLGFQALFSNIGGSHNMAAGEVALYANTTGNRNVAVGYAALASNVTTGYNVGIGNFAAHDNVANFNIGIGDSALQYNAVGEGNVAIGAFALQGVTGNSHTGNVAIGQSAGIAITTGNANVLIGYLAGDNLTTGQQNIVIGRSIDAPAAASIQTLTIGNLIFGNLMDGTGTTISTGNVGIAVNAFDATARQCLVLTNTAVAPAASANQAHLYAADISPNNAALAVWQESAPYAGIGIASTTRIPVVWNGTTYYLLATTVP